MICDWGSKVYVFFSHKKIGAFCMKVAPIISFQKIGLPGLNKSYKNIARIMHASSALFWDPVPNPGPQNRGGFPVHVQITIFQLISDRVVYM